MIPLCMRLGDIVTDESKGQTPEFPRDRPLNFPEFPEYYRSAYCEGNPWQNGDEFAIWKLHRKGELKVKWHAREQ